MPRSPSAPATTCVLLATGLIAIGSAAEADSLLLHAGKVGAASATVCSELLAELTIVRKMLRRERQFYRAASKHVQQFCIVSASHHRVEIDLQFRYSRRARREAGHIEHYQMVFVRGRNGWLLDRDIVWSRM